MSFVQIYMLYIRVYAGCLELVCFLFLFVLEFIIRDFSKIYMYSRVLDY